MKGTQIMFLSLLFDRRATLTLLLMLCIIVPLRFLMADREGSFNAGYYDELARAFRAGQTYLLRSPDPQMLALENPWDPEANEEWRSPKIQSDHYTGLHDLSLYNGKFYLLWGPLPALLLLPTTYISDHPVSPGIFALIAEMIAITAFSLTTWLLITPPGKSVSALMIVVTLCTLGLHPRNVEMMNRIAVYEISVIWDQAFFGLSLLCTAIAFKKALAGNRNPLWLVLASVCMGCSAACRINMGIAMIMLPILWVVWCRITPRLSLKKAMLHGIYFALPATLFLIAIAYYNYIRFGDITDFGAQWHLGAIIEDWGGTKDAQHISFLWHDFKRILPNLYYDFISPPYYINIGSTQQQVIGTIPMPLFISPHDLVQKYHVYIESGFGLFMASPISLAILFLPILYKKYGNKIPGYTMSGIMLLLTMLIALLAMYLPASICIRYQVEWTFLWNVIALCVVSLFLQHSDTKHRQKRLTDLTVCLVISLAHSIILGQVF